MLIYFLTKISFRFNYLLCDFVTDGVSVHNGRQTSELVIGKAEPRHAGNYTCVPANAKAASVTVHVVQSEYLSISFMIPATGKRPPLLSTFHFW